MRAGCRWPAAASLSYRYATRQLWVTDLLVEPVPTVWDLCPHHADTLTPPRGWERVDERVAVPAVTEPAAPERLAAARRPRTLVAVPAQRPAPAAQPARAPAPEAPVPTPAARAAAARRGRANRYAALAADLPRLAAEVAATTPAAAAAPVRPPASPPGGQAPRSPVTVGTASGAVVVPFPGGAPAPAPHRQSP